MDKIIEYQKFLSIIYNDKIPYRNISIDKVIFTHNELKLDLIEQLGIGYEDNELENKNNEQKTDNVKYIKKGENKKIKGGNNKKILVYTF